MTNFCCFLYLCVYKNWNLRILQFREQDSFIRIFGFFCFFVLNFLKMPLALFFLINRMRFANVLYYLAVFQTDLGRGDTVSRNLLNSGITLFTHSLKVVRCLQTEDPISYIILIFFLIFRNLYTTF